MSGQKKWNVTQVVDPISHCHSHPDTWWLLLWRVHFVKACPRNRSLMKTKKQIDGSLNSQAGIHKSTELTDTYP